MVTASAVLARDRAGWVTSSGGELAELMWRFPLEVAANPNARLSTLLHLGLAAPKVVLRNPVLRLALAGDPAGVLRAATTFEQKEGLRKLGWSEAAPPALLEVLAEHRSDRMASGAAGNPALPHRLAEKLVERALEREAGAGALMLFQELVGNASVPLEWRARLVVRRPVWAVEKLVLDAAAPPALLEAALGGLRLEDFKSPHFRRVLDGLGEHPNASGRMLEDVLELQKRLGGLGDWGWRVLAHPNLPARVWRDQFERRAGVGGRASLARNPSAPADAIEVLAREHVWEAWRHPKLRASVALRFLDLGAHVGRAMAAANPNLPGSWQVRCAVEGSDDVRLELAGNPRLVLEAAEALVERGAAKVHERLLLNPATPDAVVRRVVELERLERLAWLRVVMREDAQARVAEALAGSSAREVREIAAYGRAASPALLARLAGDVSAGVREAVASNPRTPLAVLEELQGDAAKVVAGRALRSLKERLQAV